MALPPFGSFFTIVLTDWSTPHPFSFYTRDFQALCCQIQLLCWSVQQRCEVSRLLPLARVEIKSSFTRLFEVDAVAFGHAVQRAAVNREHFGGARAAAADRLQDMKQVAALKLFERRQVAVKRLQLARRLDAARVAANLFRQVVGRDYRAARIKRRVLYR